MNADTLFRILHNRVQYRLAHGLPIDDEGTLTIERRALAAAEELD